MVISTRDFKNLEIVKGLQAIDHLQYKGPMEKLIQDKHGLVVGAFSFSKKLLQGLCSGFYPGSSYCRWYILI
jgi:hypothetical protein